MSDKISQEMVDDISVLAKLELSAEERIRVREDMEEMMRYFDGLKNLDTEGVSPMSHVLSQENVFREDEITSQDEQGLILQNAPEEKNGMFVVPQTFERV